MAKEANNEKRVKESITRDIYKDQFDRMRKIQQDTRVPIAEQLRDALDAHLGLPEKKSKDEKN